MIVYNCAQRSKMLLPALELVSTVKVLSLYAQCANMRVKMLAKFILSLMDFAVQDSHVLELDGEEVIYYRNQLAEAISKGSTSHWYLHHELLQLLVNLIKNNSKSIMTILNLVFDLLIQSLQSDSRKVLKQAEKVVLYLLDQLSAEQLEQMKKVCETLTVHDDQDIKDTAVCISRLMSGEWESMLVQNLFIFVCFLIMQKQILLYVFIK